jgi:hypothetical protein
MPKPKAKAVERVSVQFNRRFQLDGTNGKFFAWLKDKYPDWQDLVSNAAREAYWPIYLAHHGASAQEIALARQDAIASFTARLDLYMGDVPSSAVVSVPVPVGESVTVQPSKEGGTDEVEPDFDFDNFDD